MFSILFDKIQVCDLCPIFYCYLAFSEEIIGQFFISLIKILFLFLTPCFQFLYTILFTPFTVLRRLYNLCLF